MSTGMAGRSHQGGDGKRAIQVACGLGLLLAIGIGGTWVAARQRLTRLVESGSAQAGELVAVRDGWFDEAAGAPKGPLDIAAVRRFIEVSRGARRALADTIVKLESGDGLFLWFGDDRRGRAEEWKGRLAAEEKIYAAAERALGETAEWFSKANAVLQKVGGARDAALAVLGPQADLEDFEGAAPELETGAGALGDAATSVRGAAGALSGDELGTRFRKGILEGLAARLDGEAGRLTALKEALETARAELEAWKRDLAERLSEGQATLSALEAISSQVLPAAQVAFDQTRPVRDLIGRAETPIAGGEALGMIGSLFGRGGGSGSISPLGLASAASPQVSAAVEALKALCSAIETSHSELSAMAEMTAKVNGPIREFLGSQTRSAMREVVQAAPEAASYFEGRRGVLNPVFERLARARQLLDEINSAAGLARVPGAGDILRQIAGGGHQLIGQMEEPFSRGRAAIEQAAAGMRDIGGREERYLARLTALRGVESAAPRPARRGRGRRSGRAKAHPGGGRPLLP